MIFELCYIEAETTDRIPQNGLAFDADFEHLACKGKSIKCYHWQGRTAAKKSAQRTLPGPARGSRWYAQIK